MAYSQQASVDGACGTPIALFYWTKEAFAHVCSCSDSHRRRGDSLRAPSQLAEEAGVGARV